MEVQEQHSVVRVGGGLNHACSGVYLKWREGERERLELEIKASNVLSTCSTTVYIR